MANTYSGIYLHIIFSVKNRESPLPSIHRVRIYQYINSIISNHGHKPIAIGGIANHVHILLGYNINQDIPALVRDIKSCSSKFINDERFVKFKFEWQRGYAVFSNSRKELDAVIGYIQHQPEHHLKMTMEDEVKRILQRYDIEFDPAYIMKDV